jgi:ABC-type uncharacterized transport system involved in gliding motility auxiliary subunit
MQVAEGATVIVVADVDMLTNRVAYDESFFGVAMRGDNAAFVLNALEYLSGSEELIALRTRGRYNRPFEVVEEIERKAAADTDSKIKEINAKIEKHEKELRELGDAANAENIGLIQNQALAKREKLANEIRKFKRQIRELQAKRREAVEALGTELQLWNVLAAPSIILLIAIVLAVIRWLRAKTYAARRA